MPQLKLTSFEDDHDHIVFLRDSPVEWTNNIIGHTSTDNGHSHDVMIDDNGQYILLPPEKHKNAHTHQIEGFFKLDYQSAQWTKKDLKSQINYVNENQNKESKVMDDDERWRQYVDCYLSALDHENKYFTDAKRCEQFAFGGDDAWNGLDNGLIKNKRTQKDKPSLSFNMIQTTIDSLNGYVSQNASIPRYVPTEGGDAVLADILSELMYHYWQVSKGNHIRKEVNQDQIVTGRGNYEIDCRYKDGTNVDIKIKRAPCHRVAYLPYEDFDLSDCRGIAKFQWITEGQLKLRLSDDLIKKINDEGGIGHTIMNDLIGTYNSIIYPRDYLYDGNKKRVCYVIVEKKEVHKRTILHHPVTDYALDGNHGTINSGKLNKENLDRILTIPGFIKKTSYIDEIWCGHIAGGLLIHDYLSPYSGFSVCPAIGKRRRVGNEYRIKGKVHDLIDPQVELNFVRSEIAAGLRRGIGKTLLYESGAFSDESEAQEFANELSSGNSIVKIKDVEKIKEIGGAEIPNYAFTMSAEYTNLIHAISGVTTELTGQDSKANSSLLYMERVKAALVGNDYIVKNLSLADELLAKRMLDCFKILDKKTIYRILMNNNVKKKADGGVMIGGTPIDEQNFTADDIEILWKNADWSAYDIAIAFGEGSPTKRIADLKMWQEMAMQGMDVPPQFLLEMMDLPYNQKERLKALLDQQMQMSQEIEKQKISVADRQQQIAGENMIQKALLDNQTKLQINREKIMSDSDKDATQAKGKING